MAPERSKGTDVSQGFIKSKKDLRNPWTCDHNGRDNTGDRRQYSLKVLPVGSLYRRTDVAKEKP